MALIACGSSTIAYARIISANFVASRGTALGFAMTGSGMAAMILPSLILSLTTRADWRTATQVVAALVLTGAVLAAVLLRGTRLVRRERSEDAAQTSVGLGAAIRDTIFWRLAVAFAIVALGAAGIAIHFVSLLTDAGVTSGKVALLAGSTGVATVVFRIGTGWLIDRVRPSLVAGTAMLVAAAMLALLATFGADVALAGALAHGLAIGAEIDLVAFFTARYFGLRAYVRIYGLLYSTIMIGAAASPLLYAMAVDLTGGYGVALLGGAILLVIAGIIFLTLPDTRSKTA